MNELAKKRAPGANQLRLLILLGGMLLMLAALLFARLDRANRR